MALADELATHGYQPSDITSMIVEGYDILSLYIGSTVVEDDSEDVDRIAKSYIIYLLDRLAKVRLARRNPDIDVPPMMNREISDLIKIMKQTPEQAANPENILLTSTNTPIENWYDPTNPRS